MLPTGSKFAIKTNILLFRASEVLLLDYIYTVVYWEYYFDMLCFIKKKTMIIAHTTWISGKSICKMYVKYCKKLEIADFWLL